ncbi:MAG: ACT domain-containing protein, partial [Candidatus Bipolaricaulia bacterium]
AMIEIMGLRWGGTRIAITLEDHPGALAEVLGPIKDHQANIVSIATCRETCTKTHRREVVIRLEASADVAERIIAELREGGVEVLDVRRSAEGR